MPSYAQAPADEKGCRFGRITAEKIKELRKGAKQKSKVEFERAFFPKNCSKSGNMLFLAKFEPFWTKNNNNIIHDCPETKRKVARI